MDSACGVEGQVFALVACSQKSLTVSPEKQKSRLRYQHCPKILAGSSPFSATSTGNLHAVLWLLRIYAYVRHLDFVAWEIIA